jgi:hypothetical protein
MIFGSPEYKQAMAEAKALFDEWDAAQKTISFTAGNTVYSKQCVRPTLLCACGRKSFHRKKCTICRRKDHGMEAAPCQCGYPVSIGKMCSKCYWKEYNKTRVRIKKRLTVSQKNMKPVELCACGRGNPVYVAGVCLPCYSKQRRQLRRIKKAS